MAFSAIVSVWRSKEETYPILQVVQSADATDITISGDISPSLKSEMKAVLLQLCDGVNTVAGRASILLDAVDDLVVQDLDDNTITSTASISGDNRTITLTIAGSVTLTKSYLRVVMPQTLIGIYSGTTANPGDILLQTGVTPGTYTNATVRVRADGRVEYAESGVGGGAGGSLTAGSVTSTYLASNAVTTAKIADSAVTDAKIAAVSAAKVTGLPYDIGVDFSGSPEAYADLAEVVLPRAVTLAAPASHYVKTLAAGERPAANDGFVLTVYRNSTAILTVSYQADGTAAVAEPGGTSRSYAAGDTFKVTCTTADAAARNPKLTFVGTVG